MVDGCGKYARSKKENRAPKILTRTSNLSETERTTVLVRTLKIQKNNNRETNKQKEGKGKRQKL
jgi:hypothetical protein